MRAKRDQYLVGLPMAVWICSFFLPACSGADGTKAGWRAVLGSIGAAMLSIMTLLGRHNYSGNLTAAFFHGWLGTLWMANLWMIVAPFKFARANYQPGRPYFIGLWIWALAAAPLPCLIRYEKTIPTTTLQISWGFYVWWSSLLLMALLATKLFVQNGYGEPLPESAVETSR